MPSTGARACQACKAVASSSRGAERGKPSASRSANPSRSLSRDLAAADALRWGARREHCRAFPKAFIAHFAISGTLKLAPLACRRFPMRIRPWALQAMIFEQFEQVARDQDKTAGPAGAPNGAAGFRAGFAVLRHHRGAAGRRAWASIPSPPRRTFIFPVTLGEFVKFYEDAAAA